MRIYVDNKRILWQNRQKEKGIFVLGLEKFSLPTLWPHWVDKQLLGKNLCFLPSFQVVDSKRARTNVFSHLLGPNNGASKWSHCAYAAKNDVFWKSKIIKEPLLEQNQFWKIYSGQGCQIWHLLLIRGCNVQHYFELSSLWYHDIATCNIILNYRPASCLSHHSDRQITLKYNIALQAYFLQNICAKYCSHLCDPGGPIKWMYHAVPSKIFANPIHQFAGRCFNSLCDLDPIRSISIKCTAGWVKNFIQLWFCLQIFSWNKMSNFNWQIVQV